MGFTNEYLCVQALEVNCGNLDFTIEYLVNY